MSPKVCLFTTDAFFLSHKRGDTSKTLVKAVQGEKSQVEERLEQEKLQSVGLKQELAGVENRNVELTKASYIMFT